MKGSDDPGGSLYQIPLLGGAPAQVKVTTFAEAILFNGAISRDGRSMLVTRGVQARDAFLITNFR